MYFDLTGRLPGRGAYLCPDETCLTSALKQKKLRWAFHRETAAPPLPEARESLRRSSRERFVGLLGMAARSGSAVSGHDAVARALAVGKVYLLVTAHDLSEHSRGDLARLAEHVRALEFATLEELGSAIGHPGRGTVAITNPALALALAETYDRSAAFGLKI